jgi:hypothetical protein
MYEMIFIHIHIYLLNEKKLFIHISNKLTKKIFSHICLINMVRIGLNGSLAALILREGGYEIRNLVLKYDYFLLKKE